jgi:hypothetical protein
MQALTPWFAVGLGSEMKIDELHCWEDTPQLAAGYLQFEWVVLT